MDISLNDLQASALTKAQTNKLEAAQRLADSSGTDDQAKTAGEAFEKLLASMLVREMTKTLKEGFFGDSPGADTFQGWLEEHLGEAVAKDNSLGIAEAVRASLLRKQGEAAEESAA